MKQNIQWVGAKTVEYDGATISDIFIIDQIGIQQFPTIELNTQKIPGVPGVHFFSREISERTITMRVSAITDEWHYLPAFNESKSLSYLLEKSEPKPLILGSNMTFYAILADAGEIEKLGRINSTEITFVCPDPWIYGKTITEPLKAGSNSIYVTNKREVLPVFDLTGASGSVTITNSDSACSVKVLNIKPDDHIVVDMENERVLQNSAPATIDINTFDFFDLQSGENHLNLSAGAGTLTYRERRL